MKKRTAALTSWTLLVVGITAFAGSALAGNGNGNGNANGQATAPGQVKKASATATSSSGGSASQNSPSTTGVKPTTATAHDTHCTLSSSGCASTGANATTMGAGDASKRYGSGTTAAQVAQQSGVTSGTLHGPGNSQPHKMALCPGGRHEVDVHALKAKKNKTCVASQPTTTSNVSGNVTSSSHAAAVSVAGGVTTSAAGPTAQGAAPQGGVLGVTAAQGQPAGGVLGALEAVGQGKLPFTGFPLWLAAMTALSLVVFGLTLRRLGREAA
jgi:hypothetical protein